MTDTFCIAADVLGTPKDLLVTGKGFLFTGSPPPGAWRLSREPRTDGRCLKTLAQLAGLELDAEPPRPFLRAMETCISGSLGTSVPWASAMPRRAHQSFTKGLVDRAVMLLNHPVRGYYEGTWATGEALLESLQPAYVDPEVWRTLSDPSVGNWRVVKSFSPDSMGRCPRVRYNRFGTRTGRLTVEAGPQILTLKREFRGMLRSRYGREGCIVYLDFAALEPRILLYESGGRCDARDLYGHINSELFGGRMDREDIKKVVISELYGQNKWATGRRLGLAGRELDGFVNSVRGFFRPEQLLARVKKGYLQDGFVTNRYGRRVQVDEPIDRIFVNSYVQSTGVDVVLQGFHLVMNELRGSRVVPVFLLHDAVLLDCHRDELPRLREIDSVTVPGYVQKFYLSLQELEPCTPAQLAVSL